MRVLSTFSAYFLTGFVSIFISSVVVLLFLSKEINLFKDQNTAFFILLIYSGTHLVSYILVGIPIFLKYWKSPNHWIWKLKYNWLLSFGLGYLAMFFLFSTIGLMEGKLQHIDLGHFIGYSIGGSYGILTSTVASIISKLANK